MSTDKKRRPAKFEELVEIMARLREPGGCPWDREQTPSSLKPYILEEAYEVIGAVEKGDWEELCAELGDLMLQVVFQARLAEEEGRFDIDDVIGAIVGKLIRRHPHVFGDKVVEDAGAVVENWEKIKLSESPGRPVTEGIDRRLPALLRAQRMQDKVARVGFDWEEPAGALRKVEEEVGELREALSGGTSERVEEEIGDLFFAVVNVSRLAGLGAEEALRKSILKFDERFRRVEKGLRAKGLSPHEATLQEMEDLWQKAKGDRRKDEG